MAVGNNKLAKLIGVSNSTISRFAHGKDIDQTNLLKLIGHYDADLANEVCLLLEYVRASLKRKMSDRRKGEANG